MYERVISVLVKFCVAAIGVCVFQCVASAAHFFIAEREVGMNYITVKEASERWGYGEATIRKWCKDGLLSVVCKPEKVNGHWQIPANVKCPKPVKQKIKEAYK